MTPKQAGFSMPPEWAPHAACWMAWPRHEQTWSLIGLERARQAYALVAKTIAQYEPVNILVDPTDLTQAKKHLGDDIALMPFALNDSWMRDTGPTFLTNAQKELAGVDWPFNAWGENYPDYALDKQIAAHVIKKTKAQLFKAPLIMEGGAFHVDGEGTVLTTKECLLNANRNPTLVEEEIASFLCHFLGAEKVIWLNKGLVGDETNGHVDEIACFIAPGKVLALITSDKSDPNYTRLQENVSLLRAETDAKGRPLEVYTLEQPPARYLNGKRLTLSYINFYIANEGIVMPAFGQPKQDSAAKALLTSLFPKHQVVQINALDIFTGGGGIHCITQQQPLT